MQRQALASLVFLATLQFAPASSSAEDLEAIINRSCTSKSARAERDCLTKQTNDIKSALAASATTLAAKVELLNLLTKKIDSKNRILLQSFASEILPKSFASENTTQLAFNKLEENKAEDRELKDELAFVGFNWGVGLAFTSLSGQKAVKDATMIGGVVRVTEDYSHSAGLMVETHYFFEKRMTSAKQELGIGPFVALRVADTKKEKWDISAYGVGLMLGGRNVGVVKGYSLGIGYFVDTKVKRLGGGIVEGQPLPAGETVPRLQNTDASGWMVMLSSTF